MKCNRQLLSEYLDGELSAEQRRMVEAHVAHCVECASVLEEYRRMSGLIRGLPIQSVPTTLETGLAARLHGGGRRVWWRRLLAPAVELSVMAVTAILAVLVVSGALQGLYLTPPRAVTAATPGSGSTDVPTDATIRVVFDRPMDRASVEKSVRIVPSVPVDYHWQGDDLMVVPREPLRPGASYRVIVDGEAKDEQEKPVELAFSSDFITAGDDGPGAPDGSAPSAVAANQTPVAVTPPQVGVMESPSVPTPQPTQTNDPRPVETAVPRSTTTVNPSAATATVTPPPAAEAATPLVTPTATPPAWPNSNGTAIATLWQATPTKLTATPTPTAVVTAEPAFEVVRGFGLVYDQNDRVSELLGAPVESERGILAAEQPFQGGRMLWNANDRTVYVVYSDGTWRVYDDRWTQDEPESLNLPAPADLYEPARGFGKVWRENDAVRQALGWGVSKESGYVGVVQRFAGGEMFWSSQRVTYVLYEDGTWEDYPDPPID